MVTNYRYRAVRFRPSPRIGTIRQVFLDQSKIPQNVKKYKKCRLSQYCRMVDHISELVSLSFKRARQHLGDVKCRLCRIAELGFLIYLSCVRTDDIRSLCRTDGTRSLYRTDGTSWRIFHFPFDTNYWSVRHPTVGRCQHRP